MPRPRTLSVRELAEVARRRPPGPGPPRSPRHVLSTTAATCASTTSAAPCRSSCPTRPTPRPRPVSMPGPRRVPSTARPARPASLRRVHGIIGLGALGARPIGARPTSATSTATLNEPAAPNPFFVVAHVPLEDLVDESGDKSELAGELEHHGLIDVETVQRIACDATVVVAVDDALGHTMYEGRARRFPTGAQRREVIRRDRQCRFPGCAERHLCRRPSRRALETRRRDRSGQSGPALQTPPWGGAPKRLVHDRQPQRGAQHREPARPGHGVAPFGALDPGDGPHRGGENGRPA